MAHILLRHRDIPDLEKLDVYLANGGYDGLKKALGMTPAEVIGVVRAANLRGRGGAGFPAGIKWGFIPKTEGPKYILINTDESETGTFKDRELVEHNPHQVIEGAIIAAYAVGAQAHLQLLPRRVYGCRLRLRTGAARLLRQRLAGRKYPGLRL